MKSGLLDLYIILDEIFFIALLNISFERQGVNDRFEKWLKNSCQMRSTTVKVCDAESAHCLSDMACYPYPFMPISENSAIGISESIGSHSLYSDESSNSNSSSISHISSLNSLPRLNFRDHIWTYTQRYLAAEAVKEAAAATINAEESGTEEDGSADWMISSTAWKSIHETSRPACYPNPFMPISKHSASTSIPPISDETPHHEKLKKPISIAESIGSHGGLYSDGSSNGNSSSTSSLNSLPRLNFRDHIWTYTQRYLAAEAAKEATAAIINAEESSTEEEGSADWMISSTAWKSIHETSRPACYPNPFMPISKHSASTCIPLFSDETRDHKKLKKTISIAESIRSHGGLYSDGSSNSNISSISRISSLNSLSRLNFRDHIWTYTQRYLAAEAVKEAAAAIITAEENGNEEDGSADWTISSTTWKSIHETSRPACYPDQFVPISKHSASTCIPFSDETRDHEKLKKTISIAESIGSHGGLYSDGSSNSNSSSISHISSLNSLPRLNFRDHIWTYTKRYLAAEAVKEATAAIINAEESDTEEDGSADWMISSTAWKSIHETSRPACYPNQFMPISKHSASTCIPPFSDETRDHKKLKKTISIAESIGSHGGLYSDGGSNNNISSISRISTSRFACYPNQFVPISKHSASTCIPSISDETRDHEKPKKPISIAESIGSHGGLYSDESSNGNSSSTSSLNSLPRLNFRDHIWTYTQRYLAAEADKEAAEAIINAEESGTEEDGSADWTISSTAWKSIHETPKSNESRYGDYGEYRAPVS